MGGRPAQEEMLHDTHALLVLAPQNHWVSWVFAIEQSRWSMTQNQTTFLCSTAVREWVFSHSTTSLCHPWPLAAVLAVAGFVPNSASYPFWSHLNWSMEKGPFLHTALLGLAQMCSIHGANNLQTKGSLEELQGRCLYGEVLKPFGSISYTSSRCIVWIIVVTSLCSAIQGVPWPNQVLKNYTNHTSVFMAA